jgi:hypothetical protein
VRRQAGEGVVRHVAEQHAGEISAMRKRLASTSVARRPRASATQPAERMDKSMYRFVEPAAVLLRQLVEKAQERRKEAPSPERVHSDTVPQLQNDNV